MGDMSGRKRKSESTLTPEAKIKRSNGSSSMPAKISDLNIDRFALKRVVEIQALTDVIKDVGGNHQAFQKLPHHMRRRPMSHNIKRVPRRLHDVVKAELEKVKAPNKRPSRKYRRKPSNLLSEYEQRKRRIRWLDTHIWHAKRFKMIEAWGYRLPDHPSDKSIRSCYRAVQRHCLLQDVSYEHYIEVKGKRDNIIAGLSHLTDKETGPTFAAKMTNSGSKEGALYMYNYDSYPHNVLGRVTYFWHTESKKDCNGDLISTLWICCHPSFGSEALAEITKCFASSDSPESASGCGSREVKDENDTFDKVSVSSLKQVVKFRLYGPASNSVLRESLKLWSRNELCSEECANVNLCSAGDNSVDQKKVGDTQDIDCWWKTYYQSSLRQEENEKQKEVFTAVLGCRSPAEAPPHTIIAATVKDPRLLLPPKRNKVSAFDAEATGALFRTELFTEEVRTSPLLDKDVRDNVKATKISEKVFNDMRSKHLVPGTKLDLGERESRIPVILIQRPGLTDFNCSAGPCGLSSQHQIGYASGWDIIIPAGWAMAFWVAMVYRGARVGGQREAKAIALQARQFIGVRDVPDSVSGKKELEAEGATLQTKYNKRPPSKRPNYTKLGISSPFTFPFNHLCEEWLKAGVRPRCELAVAMKEDVYVLRQRNVLKMLNTVLTNPKGFLLPSTNKNNNKGMSHSLKPGSLLDKIMSMEEGKKFIECHSCALIPVAVTVLQRGVPSRNAHISIPSEEDLKKLKKEKSYGGPEENLHPDEDVPRRKAERKERLRLRKKKKSGKKSETADTAVKSNEEKRGEEAVGIINSNSCDFSIDKTSRSAVGFVTVGDYDLGQGQGAGMGFCSAKGLLHLIDAWQGNEGACLALVRNPTSLQYRFASISVVL